MFLQFNISKRISWKLLNLRYSLLIARHKVTQKIKALQMYKNNKPLLVTYFWKYLCILTSRVWVRMLTRSWDSFQALSTLMVKFYSHLKLCAVLLGCRNEENNVCVFFFRGWFFESIYGGETANGGKAERYFYSHRIPLPHRASGTGSCDYWHIKWLPCFFTLYYKYNIYQNILL